jgi:hypothetical protein
MTLQNRSQVQYDLFNAITPVATFNFMHDEETDVHVFEYSDDLKFDDKTLQDNFIVNVPMYRIEDIIQMMHGDDTNKINRYFEFVKNKKLNHCLVRITDAENHSGSNRYSYAGDKWFVLANAKTRKFVEQNTIIAMLNGNLKKKFKTYTKCVKIEDINYRKDIKRNFVSAFIQSKHMTEHVMSQVS